MNEKGDECSPWQCAQHHTDGELSVTSRKLRKKAMQPPGWQASAPLREHIAETYWTLFARYSAFCLSIFPVRLNPL